MFVLLPASVCPFKCPFLFPILATAHGPASLVPPAQGDSVSLVTYLALLATFLLSLSYLLAF